MERCVGLPLRTKCKINGCDIYAGKDILPALPETLKMLCPEGAVALLYDGGVTKIAEGVRDCLRKDGVSLFCKDVKVEGEVPEYVRLILGVGSGTVAEFSKATANKLDVDCALFITAPSTDSFLTNGECVKHIYLDERVINECPKQCQAAGWGIAMSSSLADFEDYFCRTILNQQIRRPVKNKTLPPDATLLDLALRLIEDSPKDGMEDSASVMAKLLYDTDLRSGLEPRLLGEYKFLSAAALHVFYTCFLGSPCIDCSVPPSVDKTVDDIVYHTGRKRESLMNSIDFSESSSYFRINYILGEYRLDLLERLREIDFHTAAKRWRRLYPDAGFWLKNALTARDLIKFLGATGLIGGGLANCIYKSGFTRLCA